MNIDWTIIGTIIGATALIYSMLRNIRSDITKLDDDVKGWVKHLTAVQAEQSKRTDKLHEMFYDVVKKHRQ